MEMLFTLFMITVFMFLFVFLAWSLLMLSCFTGKSIRDPTYPPVKGTVVGQLFHFKRLHEYHDYFTDIAKIHQTFRLVAPDHSELYTTDIQNIEHILKINFDGYSKGQYNRDIASDLFGEGIFAVDGDKWKQQRKLASYELSTRALRDFSCSVFRKHAVELVKVISEFSHAGLVFDVQVSGLLYNWLQKLCLLSLRTVCNCTHNGRKLFGQA